MTLFFTRIPYAVTLPDGELVDENYTGHDPLVCEFCGVKMEAVIEPDNSQHYRHVLSGDFATIKAMNCRYRQQQKEGRKDYSELKTSGELPPIPQWIAKRPPHRTIIRNWRCVLCRHRWYGNKQCPKCHDWTCSLEAY
ncbi:hypothetical protein OD218_002021 [Salmonella enterica]|uniref:Uncharacterized protein n=2 Tax=Salmonella enterica TaxID=28901 RepID=A0A744KET1_SALER|nr:hypothetical protein [Salmonella enterica subsp. diarizonae serovar 48:i:z]ECA0405752.1 hypothetical protein [Salmonella enterica subsp. enterica serovar Newport]ECA3795613.1 hypothetical protein [Salmonella enterica subsp. enterica serovar Aqua]EEH1872466.1 hypothetical protein [Salmonella enterica]EHJ5407621.1 hypothetical protein [Salmonella enterica subsp. enterica serovar Wedding]